MLEKIEKVIPEAVPAIRRLPLWVRVGALAAIAVVPFAWGWAPSLITAWRADTTIQVSARIVMVAALGSLFLASAASLAALRLRRRLRLRAFVSQWVALRDNWQLLHARVDGWLARNEGIMHPGFDEITEGVQDYYARRAPLRRLLFLLGEESLMVKESQWWRELKWKDPVFRERDYVTPFGYLLDLGAPIGNINFHGDAISSAFAAADDLIEHLVYQHPYLKRAAA